MQAKERILLVDDEPRVLDALCRALRSEFEIDTAEGGVAGMEAIAKRGPFAAVVSDLRMPGMDGVEFLAHVRSVSPDTVRIMLSGHADVDAAISAVNEGAVFRFLTKPCSAAVLAKTLEAAVEMHRLVNAEKELLQRTLMGSVTLLTEILAVIYPAAFRRSLRVKYYVGFIARALPLYDTWQFEVAAMLSQIGCITLPMGTANKIYTGAELSVEEGRLFARHPLSGKAFLARIPRLEAVSEIIAAQQKPYRDFEQMGHDTGDHVVSLGAQMLHIAIELDRLSGEGHKFGEAVRIMSSQDGEYNPELLRVMRNAGEPMEQWRAAAVPVRELETSMIAEADIRALNGLVLVAKGDLITFPALERVRCFAEELGVTEPIQVLVEQEAELAEPVYSGR